jgi:hypothetical protein
MNPAGMTFVFGTPAYDVRFVPVAAAIVTGGEVSIPFGAFFK